MSSVFARSPSNRKCQIIPKGGWAGTTLDALWVMDQWCFVACLIDLKWITADVALQLCKYYFSELKSEAFAKLRQHV